MAVQRFMRRGTQSNATARRLVASSQQPAPHVFRETVEHADIHQPVMRSLVLKDGILAGIPVFEGTHFYLVASTKFINRFYVLYQYQDGGDWLCSSNDVKVKLSCIRQVEAYRQQLRQKVAA
jgi:hypothetical protein